MKAANEGRSHRQEVVLKSLNLTFEGRSHRQEVEEEPKEPLEETNPNPNWMTGRRGGESRWRSPYRRHDRCVGREDGDLTYMYINLHVHQLTCTCMIGAREKARIYEEKKRLHQGSASAIQGLMKARVTRGKVDRYDSSASTLQGALLAKADRENVSKQRKSQRRNSVDVLNGIAMGATNRMKVEQEKAELYSGAAASLQASFEGKEGSNPNPNPNPSLQASLRGKKDQMEVKKEVGDEFKASTTQS